MHESARAMAQSAITNWIGADASVSLERLAASGSQHRYACERVASMVHSWIGRMLCMQDIGVSVCADLWIGGWCGGGFVMQWVFILAIWH